MLLEIVILLSSESSIWMSNCLSDTYFYAIKDHTFFIRVMGYWLY